MFWHFLRKDKWSPYFVGALIGILLTLSFVLGHQLGASTGVARIGALIENTFGSSHIKNTPYFNKLIADKVIFNWKVLFIVGLFFGALMASFISQKEKSPRNRIWESAFGTSKFKRSIAAFCGGALLLFGARLADGCTSGHAISGGAQLSVTSWVFMIGVFAAAIPVSFIMYRKK